MSTDEDRRPSSQAGVEPFPLRRQVEAMAGYGIPEAAIARVLEIDAAELRRLYARELDNSEVKANAKVAESLFRKATGEGRQAVTAAIFWLKTRAGWKDTSLHEVSGPDGAPIEIAEPDLNTVARVLLGVIGRIAAEEHQPS